jgi:RNA recognition motif-containing protein
MFIFPNTSDYAVFIGDLGPDVNDFMLYQAFASRYQSVRNARVVTDPITGLSKNYGFVRFGEENESYRAIREMNGAILGTRPIRVSTANNKGNTGGQSSSTTAAQQRAVPPPPPDLTNPQNTTVFVGGIDHNTTEEELRQFFIPFGEIYSVKIPSGKGFGFISYYQHQSAEIAIQRMNGSIIGNARVKVSWGHSVSTPVVTTATGATLPPKKQTLEPVEIMRYVAPDDVNEDYYDREIKKLLETDIPLYC